MYQPELASSPEFINAKVRGMRSKLYERDRLLGLADCRSLLEFSRRLYPAESFEGHAALERRLFEEHVRKLDVVARYLTGDALRLLQWLVTYYQLENIKILLRANLAHEAAVPEALLIPVPKWLSLKAEELLVAGNLRAFAEALPVPEFTDALTSLLTRTPEPDPFTLEMALDRAYLAKLAALGARMGDWVRRLVGLDVNSRGLMLLLRARFNYNRPFEEIAPYLVLSGVGLNRRSAALIYGAPQLPEAVALIPTGCLSPDLRAGAVTVLHIEDALHLHLYRLAVRCMVESMFDIATVFAFHYIKRTEFLNLLRVKESVRHSLPREQIENRLLTLRR